jgi:hypothetical protein
MEVRWDGNGEKGLLREGKRKRECSVDGEGEEGRTEQCDRECWTNIGNQHREERDDDRDGGLVTSDFFCLY